MTRNHRRLRVNGCQNLLRRHLKAVPLVAIDVNAVNPDVVVECFAVLHPKLVVEVGRLLPGTSMGSIIPPALQCLSRFARRCNLDDGVPMRRGLSMTPVPNVQHADALSPVDLHAARPCSQSSSSEALALGRPSPSRVRAEAPSPTATYLAPRWLNQLRDPCRGDSAIERLECRLRLREIELRADLAQDGCGSLEASWLVQSPAHLELR
jgi:hypothetical protein